MGADKHQRERRHGKPTLVKKNRISGQWSPRLIEMLESPAYRALSVSGHRALSRIEIELGHHGGNDNGRLPVTYDDFIEYGMTRRCIPPAIREIEALGFVEITKKGRGGNADHCEPTLFRLTFAHDRNSGQVPPTHNWRKIKTYEEAQQIAAAARANRDPRAVRNGELAMKKFRSRCAKVTPVPVRKSDTENSELPVRKSDTTGSVQKLTPLSRVWEGAPANGLRLVVSDTGAEMRDAESDADCIADGFAKK